MPNHSPIHLTRSKRHKLKVRSLLFFFVVILNAVKDPRIFSLPLLLLVLRRQPSAVKDGF
jgi:hypothetical protein